MTKPSPTVHVERVLPKPGERADLTPNEVDAILEAAYLATAADGELSPEEETAFRSVMARLHALVRGGSEKPVFEGEFARAFEGYAVRSDRAAREERIKALRAHLARPLARDLAYKIAFAMSLCDLASTDGEQDLDDALIEAFGLSDDEADALAGEVYAALDEDAGEES
jgi:glutathione S-transferase